MLLYKHQIYVTSINYVHDGVHRKLSVCRFPDPQWQLDQLKKDDWLLSSIYDHDEMKCITFCYIIKDKDLWIVVNKFKDNYKRSIEKSKKSMKT